MADQAYRFKLCQSAILRLSDENTLRLIELYRQEECLWNTRCKSFRDRWKRTLAADKIAAELNIDHFESKHVMIKFKNLRNSYCQELKKIANSLDKGGEIYRPKVIWFPKMDSFLRPHLQGTYRITKAQEALEEEERNSDELSKGSTEVSVKEEVDDWCASPEQLGSPGDRDDDDDDDAPLAKRRLVEHMPAPQLVKTEPVGYTDPVTTQMMTNFLAQLAAAGAARDDPFDSFGRYIATLLRSMPRRAALALQPRVVALVAEAALSSEPSETMNRSAADL